MLRKAIKLVYRVAFKARRATVVFQNAADQEKLIQLGITDGERARLIRGSGVDIDRFCPTHDSAGHFHAPLQLLFPSRLIREKGTSELLAACRQLWDDGLALELLVAGALDAASDIVVLPSWREGLSRALIEAAAMERPIITTDVPGCRDVVDHGRSGLLVPLHDARGIGLAIGLLHDNPDLARRFGKAARQKVVAEFQVSLVNQNTLAQYERLLGTPLSRKPLLEGMF